MNNHKENTISKIPPGIRKYMLIFIERISNRLPITNKKYPIIPQMDNHFGNISNFKQKENRIILPKPRVPIPKLYVSLFILTKKFS
jgi:hypothetical protein